MDNNKFEANNAVGKKNQMKFTLLMRLTKLMKLMNLMKLIKLMKLMRLTKLMKLTVWKNMMKYFMKKTTIKFL